MADREMSQAQADSLAEAREQLQSLEGKMQMACTLAVQAINFSSDVIPPSDQADFGIVKRELRNLISWVAEYCRERERSKGLEEVNSKLYEAWNGATVTLSIVRVPADEEHGNYPSLHYALDSLVKKVYDFVAATAKLGEGGIDKRWFPDKG